jgi:hypothetical protein
MSHRMAALGLLTWPSKEAEELAADKIADDFTDQEVREVTDKSGLTLKEAGLVMRRLASVASDLHAKTGGARDLGVNKIASEANPVEAAYYAADCVMMKAAAEAEAGNMVTGDGSHQHEMAAGTGPVDAAKNPSSEWVGEQGTTRLDTKPGAVGAEQPQEKKPGASDITPSEVAKLSAFLQKLSDEMAPVGTPNEPKDNFEGAGAIEQGKTVQPKGPQMGEQKPQPAKQQTSAATPNEPSKLAQSKLARALNVLAKLSEEMEEKDEKDEKDEKKEEGEKKEDEKKEDEKKPPVPPPFEPKTNEGKSAAVMSALKALSDAVR